MISNTRNRIIATAAAVGALVPMASFAVGTDPFNDALATVTDKTGVYAAALVGVAAVAVIFMVAKKYVKKLSGAS